jgi:hypothetical protein
MLGVSPATVLDRRERGDLPGFKLWNGPVRFRESGVLAVLETWRRGLRRYQGGFETQSAAEAWLRGKCGGGCRASAGDSYASWAIAAASDCSS